MCVMRPHELKAMEKEMLWVHALVPRDADLADDDRQDAAQGSNPTHASLRKSIKDNGDKMTDRLDQMFQAKLEQTMEKMSRRTSVKLGGGGGGAKSDGDKSPSARPGSHTGSRRQASPNRHNKIR